jgi:hypothetical protein
MSPADDRLVEHREQEPGHHCREEQALAAGRECGGRVHI